MYHAGNETEYSDYFKKGSDKKTGNYGKYTALTALGTFLIWSPQSAKATSAATAILRESF